LIVFSQFSTTPSSRFTNVAGLTDRASGKGLNLTLFEARGHPCGGQQMPVCERGQGQEILAQDRDFGLFSLPMNPASGGWDN